MSIISNKGYPSQILVNSSKLFHITLKFEHVLFYNIKLNGIEGTQI